MKKPNIIYILADDMGYGDISYLNENSKIKTPNIDKIAQEGISFSDAHSSSAVCTPSRYSILTGRYNWRSKLKEGVLFGYDQALIEPQRSTIATMLKDNGFTTAAIGKWHLGWDWAKKGDAPEDIDFTKPISNGPCSHGFDYFYGIIGSLDMCPYVYVENDMPTTSNLKYKEGYPDSDKKFWRSGLTAEDFDHNKTFDNFKDRVINYIENHAQGEKPFFLYYPLTAPHTPILPAAEFLGKSGTNEYGDFCLMIDNMISEIYATLEKQGILDDTIIVFTSDNGCSPMADFAELAQKGHNPSYIFRGYKSDIYEGGHRIPLIIRYPKLIEFNRKSSETVCLVDMYATLADILDIDIPDNAAEDSVSNLAVWQGGKLSKDLREATVHHSIDGSFSIRKGDWKLELCPGSGGWSNPVPEGTIPAMQLYNLKLDISETKNLYTQYPEIVEELKSLLATYVKNGRSTPGEAQENTPPNWWKGLDWMLI